MAFAVFGVTFEMALKKADDSLSMNRKESLTEHRERVKQKAEELYARGDMEPKQISTKKSAPQFCRDFIELMEKNGVKAYGLSIRHYAVVTTPEGRPVKTKAGNIKREWRTYTEGGYESRRTKALGCSGRHWLHRLPYCRHQDPAGRDTPPAVRRRDGSALKPLPGHTAMCTTPPYRRSWHCPARRAESVRGEVRY
jgi:hypothetical protein